MYDQPMIDEPTDLWVFAYGSLMWKPGFAFVERRRARMPDYCRRFCLDFITYRGTPESPGLVLGLDEEAGTSCEGIAYLVAPELRAEVHAYLRERELVTYAYQEKFLPIDLEGGERVMALAYVMDHSHAQYRPGLSLADQAAVIAHARGDAGENIEYLVNTVTHLAEMGVDDQEISEVHRLAIGLLRKAPGQ